MAKLPTKTADRISAGIKRFQPILAAAKSRDVGESDTVTIVVDILADIFGYDKYSEITSEHAIRGTYCDLATRLDGVLQMLIEVKAIGLELKEMHVKQAVDYAANQGVDWVVLTNGITWRIYKVTFAKPISAEVVIDIDFSTLNSKSAKDIESLYLFCKEGWIKSVLGEYHSQKQALSRFYIGAMVLTDPVLQLLRRELRRMFPVSGACHQRIPAGACHQRTLSPSPKDSCHLTNGFQPIGWSTHEGTFIASQSQIAANQYCPLYGVVIESTKA